MPFMISGEEFIRKIREIDEILIKARISSVEVVKKERRIKYYFICENVVDENLQKKVWVAARNLTPKTFEKVNVYFSKIVSDNELINAEIYKYISENLPSVAVMLKTTDIKSVVVGDNVKYSIKLTEDGAEYFTRSKCFDKINAYLSKKFCSDFYGTYEIKEREERESLLTEEVYAEKIEKISLRTIKLKSIYAIDDPLMGNTAIYIEDAKSGSVVVCGKIYEIVEKTTKNGKPFFIIRIDDTTGRISGVYFTRTKTYDKIKNLKEGDAIIVSGRMGEYNGNPSFTMEKINACEFPEDFVKKDRYKKPAPAAYKTVFPTPATTVKVKSVFEEEDVLPPELTEKEYVVFDIETTGLDLTNCEITEIGAVKVKNGKIAEQFTSLIKPDGKIPEEITALTGIDDGMVKDAPKIYTVLPDFLKFTDGATVVAQNAEFDSSFIKKYANAADYAFDNPVLDTMVISRQLISGLAHYNLKTLAEYFHITFRHHRALSDAYATAEIFIELIKIKNGGKKPN